MKQTKRLLLMVLVALVSTHSANAYDFVVDQIRYSVISDTEVAVYGLNTSYPPSTVTIPENVYGYTVTEIIYGPDAKEVILPNTIKKIHYTAFYNNTQLERIQLSNSLEYIGISAFYGCTNLTSINVDERNYSFRSIDGILFTNDCDSLIQYPDKKIGYLSTRSGYNITVLPQNLRYICYGAFENVQYLREIHLPNSVSWVDAFNFTNAEQLRSVTVPCRANGGYISGIRNYARNLSTLYDYSTLEIGNSAATLHANIYKQNKNKSVLSGSSTILKNSYNHNTVVQVTDTKSDLPDFLPNSFFFVQSDGQWKANKYMIYDADAFYCPENLLVDNLCYIRTFNTNKWQALYVPFDMEYADWADKGEVAEISGVHQYDGNDGQVTVIEFHKLKSGDKVKANTPYVFRINENLVGEPVTFSVENATLQPTENGSVWCASTRNTYTLTGVYEETGIEDMYAIKGGEFVRGDATARIAPFRFYLSVNYNDHGYGVGDGNGAALAPQRIGIMVDGEETSIEDVNLGMDMNNGKQYYDLQGRRVLAPQKGSLYIVNGKKVLY